MSLVSRLVGRRRPTKELKWEIIPASATGAYPEAMPELIDRRRDGITVTDVLTQDELAAALPKLEAAEKIQTSFGYLLGMSLGAIGPDEPNRDRYYDDRERVKEVYQDAFGFDIHERVASVLKPMAHDLPMVAPTEDGRSYAPAQIRWWNPGQGGLPAHVGNEFRRELEDGAMSHLVTVSQVTNHLSYFVILQKPEVGGALSVYDLIWEDYDTHEVPWQDCQRDDSWFEGVSCTKIDPEPGSLVVFGGGWRWHRVDPPQGPKARISYGGFCAPSVDEREIHFWT